MAVHAVDILQRWQEAHPGVHFVPRQIQRNPAQATISGEDAGESVHAADMSVKDLYVAHHVTGPIVLPMHCALQFDSM